jgi:hypothetical protein
MKIDRRRALAPILSGLVIAACPLPGWSQPPATADSRFGIGVEFGPLWFSRNDVRIPGDGGTRFDMLDLTGSGPESFARLDGHWNLSDRHGLRLVLAPLELSGVGLLPQDTEFAGTTFPAGSTEGIYQFDTYKLTYRYTFRQRGAWRWRLGFTGVVRDANVELRQGNLQANDDNLGFVPALHVSGDYRFADRWQLVLDFDGLAGGPGRLFDVALKVQYDLSDSWRIGAGYRTIEGGVDIDDVYNFGWLHFAVLDLRYRLR